MAIDNSLHAPDVNTLLCISPCEYTKNEYARNDIIIMNCNRVNKEYM